MAENRNMAHRVIQGHENFENLSNIGTVEIIDDLDVGNGITNLPGDCLSRDSRPYRGTRKKEIGDDTAGGQSLAHLRGVSPTAPVQRPGDVGQILTPIRFSVSYYRYAFQLSYLPASVDELTLELF